MSVHKTAAGSYRVMWREPDGTQKQRTFKRRKDADRVDREIIRRLELAPFGMTIEREASTVDALNESWLKAAKLERNTRASYEVTYRVHLKPRVGDLDVRALTPARIKMLAAELEAAGLGVATRHKALAVLSGMLRYAILDGLIESHPMRGAVKIPQAKRARVIAPAGPEAIWRLADELERDDDIDGRMLALLIGFAGLRPEEALGLDWRDVGKRTLNIERAVAFGEAKDTKTTKPRTVELLPALERELVRFRLEHGLPDRGPVLDREGYWNEWAYRNWRRRSYYPAARRAGVEGPPKDLRHAFASLLLHEGRNPVEVAAQLGHSPAVCLNTYGHVIAELARARRTKASTAVERARKATLRGANVGAQLASSSDEETGE